MGIAIVVDHEAGAERFYFLLNGFGEGTIGVHAFGQELRKRLVIGVQLGSDFVTRV